MRFATHFESSSKISSAISPFVPCLPSPRAHLLFAITETREMSIKYSLRASRTFIRTPSSGIPTVLTYIQNFAAALLPHSSAAERKEIPRQRSATRRASGGRGDEGRTENASKRKIK